MSAWGNAWADSWGNSWGSVAFDPNAMRGNASFSINGVLTVASGEMVGSASITFLATLDLPAPTSSLGSSFKKPKFYVKRKKQIYLFDSAEEADAWQEADAKAEEAIEKAQKTSRRARKRVKDRVFIALKEPESIQLDLLGKLVDRYSIPVDLPKLIAEQNLELIAAIYLLAMHKQDEEEVELLLLA